MISPIKANALSVTSYYGKRTYTYQGKKVTDFHNGIDLIANPRNNNAEIVAVEAGTVTGVQKTGEQYGTGCYVRIRHDNGLYTLYYHLRSGSIVVNKGDHVSKGQKLGIIGTTGVSTGIHLHFQIDRGSSSTSINPYDYVFNGKNIIDGGSTPTPAGQYNIGDEVYIEGNLYRSSNADSPAGSIAKRKTRITRYANGAKHPYNTTGDLGWMDASSITPIVTYTTGNYKTRGAMNVRTGAGTNNAIKKVKDLTADGKKHATNTSANANAVYKAGTVFTALEIVTNAYGVWGRSPSGWICIKGASGTVYCDKC